MNKTTKLAPIITLAILMGSGATVAGVAQAQNKASTPPEVCSVDVSNFYDDPNPEPGIEPPARSALDPEAATSPVEAVEQHDEALEEVLDSREGKPVTVNTRLLEKREEGASEAKLVTTSQDTATFEYEDPDSSASVVLIAVQQDDSTWRIEEETVTFPEGTNCESDLIGKS